MGFLCWENLGFPIAVKSGSRIRDVRKGVRLRRGRTVDLGRTEPPTASSGPTGDVCGDRGRSGACVVVRRYRKGGRGGGGRTRLGAVGLARWKLKGIQARIERRQRLYMLKTFNLLEMVRCPGCRVSFAAEYRIWCALGLRPDYSDDPLLFPLCRKCIRPATESHQFEQLIKRRVDSWIAMDVALCRQSDDV